MCALFLYNKVHELYITHLQIYYNQCFRDVSAIKETTKY